MTVMIETQKSISDWADVTFGPSGSDLRCATRANEEMAELLTILSEQQSPFTVRVPDDIRAKACEEAADVCVCLFRLAARSKLVVARKGFTATWLSSPATFATSANDKMSYLMLHVAAGETNLCYIEDAVSAVFTTLRALVEKLGSNLDEEIDRKMAKNRARKWVLDGTGCGYHVKDVPTGVPSVDLP